MIEFLLSTTFLIPAALIVALIIGIFLEVEKFGWASTIFCVSVALFGWTHKEFFLDFVKNNPIQIIEFALAYIVIGILWSITKWILFIRNLNHSIERSQKKFYKKDFTDLQVLEKLCNEYNIMFYKSSTTYESFMNDVTPEASDKKALIVSWIAYFPMSMMATLLNDPVRRFFEILYDNISGLYDKIALSYKKKTLAKINKNNEN